MSDLETRYLIAEAYVQHEDTGIFEVDTFMKLASVGIVPERLMTLFDEGAELPLSGGELDFVMTDACADCEGCNECVDEEPVPFMVFRVGGTI